jgi:hypothetical protein
VVALVCLGGAIICALIARVLLLIAALNISIWWAVGVFLPFGPTLFRLNYPEAARSSFIFRMATLGCIFLYVVAGPGAFVSPLHHQAARPSKPAAFGFGSEILDKLTRPLGSGGSKKNTRPFEERRTDNEKQFERLRQWDETLRQQKATLLPADAKGAQAYAIDLQEYNEALLLANAERRALAGR